MKKEGTNNRTSAQDAPVPWDTQVHVALFWSPWIFLIFSHLLGLGLSWSQSQDLAGLEAGSCGQAQEHKCQLRAQRRFLRKSLEEEGGRMVSLDLTAPWEILTSHSTQDSVPRVEDMLPREDQPLPPCWGFVAFSKHFGAKLDGRISILISQYIFLRYNYVCNITFRCST